MLLGFRVGVQDARFYGLAPDFEGIYMILNGNVPLSLVVYVASIFKDYIWILKLCLELEWTRELEFRKIVLKFGIGSGIGIGFRISS